MPIKPENRHRYPPDWRETRQRILARAGDCCELCGAPDRVWVVRDPKRTVRWVEIFAGDLSFKATKREAHDCWARMWRIHG